MNRSLGIRGSSTDAMTFSVINAQHIILRRASPTCCTVQHRIVRFDVVLEMLRAIGKTAVKYFCDVTVI